MFPNATRSPSPSKRVERESHEIIQDIRGRIRSGYRSRPMGIQPHSRHPIRHVGTYRIQDRLQISRPAGSSFNGVENRGRRKIVRKSSIYEKPSRQKQTRNSFQTRIKHAVIHARNSQPSQPGRAQSAALPEAIHAVVSAATSGSSRPLWRLDGDRLYIVSDQLDTDRLEARLGKPVISTLDYRPFLDKLQNGETRRFALTATPVASKDGKRTPLRTPAGMHQWAERKLTRAGARLMRWIFSTFTPPDSTVKAANLRSTPSNTREYSPSPTVTSSPMQCLPVSATARPMDWV